MKWQSGNILKQGRYKIIKVLGEGGFGITYLATDTIQHRQVVIKTLNEIVQKRKDFSLFQQKFLGEIKYLSQFKHNHIVKYYDHFKEGNLWCLVMEYIEGVSLTQFIANQGVLTQDQAIRYINQIGNAVQTIHKQNLLHRDIKPDNIIRRKNTNEVVLIDFGIAREFFANETNSHTAIFTNGYAPPEQYFSKRKPGCYTDVYALGATFYVMLTGYRQDKYGNLIPKLPLSIQRENDILNNKPDPLLYVKTINQNVTTSVAQSTDWAMEIKSQNRPQSVLKWLDSLKNPNFIYVKKSTSQNNPNFNPQASISQVLTRTLGSYYNQFSSYYNQQTNMIQNLIKWSPLMLIGSVFILYYISPNRLLRIKFGSLPEPTPTPTKTESPNVSETTSTPKVTQTPETKIKIDYSKLENFLKNKEFKKADGETLRIFLELTDRTKQWSLKADQLSQISCEYLININDLWLNYSENKFGFSLQRNLWQELGGQNKIFNKNIADQFGEKVGWKNSSSDKLYKDMIYDLSAPQGHLPKEINARLGQDWGIPYFSQKVDDCKIP
jgi:eukaryotic-like serine/threonine-protein kinase